MGGRSRGMCGRAVSRRAREISGAGIARSGSSIGLGDHLSSKPFHIPRMDGITSRANNSVFLRTSSGGIEPICCRIIRWPQLRLFIAWVKRSRTVLGEPAMT